jgi:peptidylprolyl isomerase
VPPRLGYGAEGNADAGIGGTDTIYFLIDILGRAAKPEKPAPSEDASPSTSPSVDPSADPSASGTPSPAGSPSPSASQ